MNYIQYLSIYGLINSALFRKNIAIINYSSGTFEEKNNNTNITLQ